MLEGAQFRKQLQCKQSKHFGIRSCGYRLVECTVTVPLSLTLLEDICREIGNTLLDISSGLFERVLLTAGAPRISCGGCTGQVLSIYIRNVTF